MRKALTCTIIALVITVLVLVGITAGKAVSSASDHIQEQRQRQLDALRGE